MACVAVHPARQGQALAELLQGDDDLVHGLSPVLRASMLALLMRPGTRSDAVLAGQADIHPARIATCGLIENKDAVNALEVAISGSRG